jgi:hypothetical protein
MWFLAASIADVIITVTLVINLVRIYNAMGPEVLHVCGTVLIMRSQGAGRGFPQRMILFRN